MTCFVLGGKHVSIVRGINFPQGGMEGRQEKGPRGAVSLSARVQRQQMRGCPLQRFTLFEMLVIVDKVVTALTPCSSVYADVLAGEGRGGEAERAGEWADGVVVIGRLFGEGVEERIRLWSW